MKKNIKRRGLGGPPRTQPFIKNLWRETENKHPSGPEGLNISREKNWSYVEECSICVVC